MLPARETPTLEESIALIHLENTYLTQIPRLNIITIPIHSNVFNFVKKLRLHKMDLSQIRRNRNDLPPREMLDFSSEMAIAFDAETSDEGYGIKSGFREGVGWGL